MKVSLLAAVTADGFIARDESHLSTDWTCAEDKKFFRDFTKAAGVMVTGYKSFATYGRALPGRRNIVYTRRDLRVDNIETTIESPEALVERLASEGVEHLVVCGGAQIYTMFLKSGLVTDVHLNYHFVVFGSGVKLLNDGCDLRLRIADYKCFDEMFAVHYCVELG